MGESRGGEVKVVNGGGGCEGVAGGEHKTLRIPRQDAGERRVAVAVPSCRLGNATKEK